MSELFIVKSTKQLLVGILDAEAQVVNGLLFNALDGTVTANSVVPVSDIVNVRDCNLPTVKAEDGTDVKVLPLNPAAVNPTVVAEDLSTVFVDAPGISGVAKVAILDVNAIVMSNATLFV